MKSDQKVPLDSSEGFENPDIPEDGASRMMLAFMKKFMAESANPGVDAKVQHEDRRRACIDKCKRSTCVAKSDDGSGRCGLCNYCHTKHNLNHEFVDSKMFRAAKSATEKLARASLELKVRELAEQLAAERQKHNRERFTDGLKPEDLF